MIPLLSAVEALDFDRRVAAAWGLDPLLLMETAASNAFRVLGEALRASGLLPGTGPASGRVPRMVALAGGGSNGGDALALLRKAAFAGWQDLSAIMATDAPGPAAAAQLSYLKAAGIPCLSWSSDRAAAIKTLGDAELLIDGIAGIGLRGELRGSPRSLAEAAAASGTAVAAMDLPSGLGDDREPASFVLPARWTLSIEPRKAALYTLAGRSLAGEILPVFGVFPVGAAMAVEAQLLEEADLSALLPGEMPQAHKNERGRVGILAGSPGYAGAASLALQGAAASGAGFVTLFAPPGLHEWLAAAGCAVIGATAGVVVRPVAALEVSLEKLDLLLVGPGWLVDEEGRALLGRLLDRGFPLVLDAGALRLLPDYIARGFKARGPLLLTPHPGEFETLSGMPAGRALAAPAPALRGIARTCGASIALKAALTWIVSEGCELAVFEGNEPSLGIAGSGDVLAGLAAGFLARLGPRGGSGREGMGYRALRAAVMTHGMAGRRARARIGFFTAERLAREIAALAGGGCDAD